MARTKKAQSTGTATLAEKKVKVATVGDNDSVVVINANLAGKKTNVHGQSVVFDSEGKATVIGQIAKIFLSCGEDFSVEGAKFEAKPESVEEETEETKETVSEE